MANTNVDLADLMDLTDYHNGRLSERIEKIRKLTYDDIRLTSLRSHERYKELAAQLEEMLYVAQRPQGEELAAQVEMLPDPSEVSAVLDELDADDLRTFAAAIMNAAVDSARSGYAAPDTIRLMNDWFASMEETASAGDSLDEILSRRRKRR